MKFIIDAQLLRRMVKWLENAGHHAIHTRYFPLANKTSDTSEKISLEEKRIVITKDADFVSAFMLHQRPYKLLLISTGNIKNAELEIIFKGHLDEISEGFEIFSFIEIDRVNIIFHQ